MKFNFDNYKGKFYFRDFKWIFAFKITMFIYWPRQSKAFSLLNSFRFNIEMGESRDETNHHRFFSINPNSLLLPGVSANSSGWELIYWHILYYPHKDGVNCCSSKAISFHYVTPSELYVFDYFIYKLKVYD